MSLKNKSILIIEDNPINRVTYQIALMRSEARLVFERWGDGTIKTLLSMHRVDLIVMDLMLTRYTNGYSLFEQIRQMNEYANVPIVAISAAEPYTAMAKCREMGFNGYIPKPIREEILVDQLEAIINGQEIWIMS